MVVVLDDPSTASLDSGPVDVAARLAAVEADLASLAGELVPERIAGHTLGRVVTLLGKIERRAGGARIVLTKAAADTGAWRTAGARSPEEALARANGTSVGDAKADLRASAQLAGLPAARDAAASGDLSAGATRAVAEGASADPGAEADLVAKAKGGDLTDVRHAARRCRQHADERSGQAAQRMYRRRSLRTWVELDGEGRGAWNVPPGYQAVLLAALEPYRQAAFRLARESGQRPTPEALMADALQMLALDVLADRDLPDPTAGAADPRTTSGDDSARDGRPAGDGPAGPSGQSHSDSDPKSDSNAGVGRSCAAPSGDAGPNDPTGLDRPPEAGRPAADHPPGADPGPRRSGDASGSRYQERVRGAGNRRAPAQVNVHVDYPALARGHALDGEMCEITGLGPIPVSLARSLAQDAMLRLIVTGTHDVMAITSQRRYIPAPLRAAVVARDRTCVVPSCHATHHLEIDHTTDFALGGPTALANLARLCRYHHALKTHCAWTLTGRPGTWTFQPP